MYVCTHDAQDYAVQVIKCYRFIVDILLMNFSCRVFRMVTLTLGMCNTAIIQGDSFRGAPPN